MHNNMEIVLGWETYKFIWIFVTYRVCELPHSTIIEDAKKNDSLSKLFIYSIYIISQRVYKDIIGRHDTPKPTVDELY